MGYVFRTRIVVLLACAIGVAACNTPTVGFQYTDKQALTVRGHDFIVYYTATHAQAVRTSNIRLSQAKFIALDARHAIEMASGCRVRDNTIQCAAIPL